jgi:ATP-dependent Clp protease ATP-binding subunit ClpC
VSSNAAGPAIVGDVMTGAFDRLSPHAKRALALAGSEAARLRHEHVEPEHVLLGLLACDGSVPERVLALSGIDLRTARQALEAMIGRGDADEQRTDMWPSPDTKRLAELASDEAQQGGARLVDPEHLLLALVREPGRVERMLNGFGLSAEAVRQKVLAAKSG